MSKNENQKVNKPKASPMADFLKRKENFSKKNFQIKPVQYHGSRHRG